MRKQLSTDSSIQSDSGGSDGFSADRMYVDNFFETDFKYAECSFTFKR